MRIVSHLCTLECDGLEVDLCNISTDLETTLDNWLCTLCGSVTVDSYRTTENNTSKDIWSLGISYLDNGCLVCDCLSKSLRSRNFRSTLDRRTCPGCNCTSLRTLEMNGESILYRWIESGNLYLGSSDCVSRNIETGISAILCAEGRSDADMVYFRILCPLHCDRRHRSVHKFRIE